MYDNFRASQPAPIGSQIRALRVSKGWSLAELARRVGTSTPTLHRYESGWDRFEVGTLRRVARALGASLEIRLLPSGTSAPRSRPAAHDMVRLLRPLFWDKPLAASDLIDHRNWVLARVLVFGDRAQAETAREFFCDEAIGEALERREIDARTRAYWDVILGKEDASEGS
jgi:transcriptional regulator with XRE-family HTH domain